MLVLTDFSYWIGFIYLTQKITYRVCEISNNLTQKKSYIEYVKEVTNIYRLCWKKISNFLSLVEVLVLLTKVLAPCLWRHGWLSRTHEITVIPIYLSGLTGGKMQPVYQMGWTCFFLTLQTLWMHPIAFHLFGVITPWSYVMQAKVNKIFSPDLGPNIYA